MLLFCKYYKKGIAEQMLSTRIRSFFIRVQSEQYQDLPIINTV